MLTLRVRPINFFLSPLLAMSNSLLVSRAISSITPKMLSVAIKPIAAMVVTVVTVTVETITLPRYMLTNIFYYITSRILAHSTLLVKTL